jgi:hypothetical protein
MVVKAVEESCRKSGIARVTLAELETIRSKVPARYSIFGKRG